MTSKLNINWLNKCRCGNRMHTVETVRGSHVRLFEDDAVKCNACGREGVIQTCDAIATVLWETDEERAESVTMTKSTITRERAQQIFLGNGPELSASEERELARMALSAMDQKPAIHRYRRKAVEPYGPYPWHYEEFVDLSRPLEGIEDEYYYAAPPAVSGFAVDGEPAENHIGSKNALDAIVSFIKSKGNPTVKCYEEVSEQLFKDNCHGIHSHVIEYILKLGEELEDFRAEQDEAQPAPVVPDDVLAALQKVARISLDMNDFDGDRRGIADCLGDAEEALIEVVNRRAVMLAASPQSPGSEPATVPGKWIPVSERVPESNGVYFGWDGKRVLEVNCFFGGFSANQFIHGEITHWMPLPEPPTEVK